MTDHRVESIVAAVQTAVTGLTTTSTRVFRGRVYALQAAQMPGLLIYMGGDRRIQQLSQVLEDWELTLFIESRVKTVSAQLDTELNKIRREVTIALNASYTLGLSYVIDTSEGEAAAPELSGEGEQPAAAHKLTWFVRYRRSRADPGA